MSDKNKTLNQFVRFRYWIGLFFFLSGTILSFAAQTAEEKSTRTYYVSASEGNDSNKGLDVRSPIRSLTRASQLELRPGDKLLLKSGDLWKGESLFPKGRGAENRPIEISSYGEGTRPRIVPGIGKLFYGIRLVDTDGFIIRNLEISDCYGGIVVWTENTYNHRFLRIDNCFFHDITGKDTGFCVGFYENLPPDLLYGTGVMIAGSDAVGDSTLFSDMTISDCEFDRCDVGIQILPRDHRDGIWSQRSHDLISCNAYKNVVLRNCNVLRSYRTGGVMLYCVSDGIAENILVDRTGYENIGMFWGVAAFQATRVSDFLIRKCTFSNTIKGNSPDGQGFDFESDCHRVVLKDCRIMNNDGSAVLFCGGNTWPGSNSDIIIDGCHIEGNNSSGDFYNNTFSMMSPNNLGIVKNTTIRLLSAEQGFSCYPLIFDPSNRVYDPAGNSIFSGGPSRKLPLFEDDFQNVVQNRTTKKWTGLEMGDVRDGKVVLSGRKIVTTAQAERWENIFFEVDIAVEKGRGALLFRVQNDNNYYSLVMDTDGDSTLKFLKTKNGEETLLGNFSCLGLKTNKEYQLRVETFGKRLRVFINGNQRGEVEDETFSSGGVGFQVDPFSRAMFGNVFVGSLNDTVQHQ